MVIVWALNINSHLTVSAYANRVLSAEAMACSGAEVALNPTCYVLSEFQMILSIVFSKPGVVRTQLMEQPTIPRWIKTWRFLSWASQTPERGDHNKLMEFKPSSCTKAQTLCFAS